MKANLARHGFWAALLALVLFYGLGQLNGMASQQERDWRTAARLAQRAGKPFRDSMEAGRQREARLLATLRQTRTQLAAALADTLPTVVLDSLPPAVRVHLLTLHGNLESCVAALDSAVVGLGDCQRRADWAVARADSLEGLLTRGLRVTQCRILFLPCPSRVVTLLGGAALGFGLGSLR